MKQLIKIALLCLFPLISIAQTPAYQRTPRSLRVTDNGQIYKWKDSIYYKNELAKMVDTFSNQNIRGKKIFINNVSLIDTSSIDTIPVNNAQLALSRFYSNEPLRFTGTYDPIVGRPQIFATGRLDANYIGTDGDMAGGWLKWKTSGSKGNMNGIMLQLEPGYDGSGTTRVIDAQNYIKGSKTLDLLDVSGNIGVAAESQGAGTGDNIGVYGIAGFAKNRNVAGYFRAMQDQWPGEDYHSKQQIGVFGLAGRHNSVDTVYQIGGYFALQAYGDAKSGLNSNSALIADNGDMPHPIFIGRTGNTNDVFKIKRYGDVSIKSIGTTDIPLSIETNASITNDIVKIYKGSDKMTTISRFGDIATRGRILFYDNNDTTAVVQALYVNSTDGIVAVRAGARANTISLLNSTASSFATFKGASSSLLLGSDVQLLSSPTNGARIGGPLILGTDGDSLEKLQVSGNAKITGGVYGQKYTLISGGSFDRSSGYIGVFNDDGGGQPIIKGAYNENTIISPARDDINNLGDVVIRGGGADIAKFNSATKSLDVNGNIKATGFIATSVPEYADNAAAVVGGLPIGSFYRTGDLLKVVH